MNPSASSANPYAAPKAQVSDVAEATLGQPIWNPNAAASWSIIFTPAFGALLHMLNWQAMGESDRAASQRAWFYVSLAMLAVYLVLAVAIPNAEAADGASRAIGFGYLLAWYFASAKAQAKYVRERWGKDYPRRGWGKPILIGIAAIVGYFMVAVAIGIALGLSGGA